MNVFSASPVQSCDLTSGRLRKPRPPRDPEGRRRSMVFEILTDVMFGGFALLALALGVGAWTALIAFILPFVRDWRWKKSK